MSTKYYKISLKPLNRFFFGGEITFGQAVDEPRSRSYLIKSSILPQQTSLLGMLRYELLRYNKLLAPYPSQADGKGTAQDAAALVGTTGFTLPEDWPTIKAANNYGVIDGLSPLCLHDGSTYWYPSPLDDGQEKKTSYRWDRIANRYWQLSNFSAKNPPELRFRSGNDESKKLDDLFHATALTGNRVTNRNYREEETSGAAGEEGLFRQTFRQNTSSTFTAGLPTAKREKMDLPAPSDFSFIFRVAIDHQKLDQLPNTQWLPENEDITVSLGGEGGQFLMRVQEVKDQLGLEYMSAPEYQFNDQLETTTFDGEDADAKTVQFGRIVLLSDTYLPESVRARKDLFLLGHPKSFRFLSSSLRVPGQFASIVRPAEEVDGAPAEPKFGRRTPSPLFTLIERGGVMIAPKTELLTIVEEIQNVTPFHSIGYNYCDYVK